MLLLAGVFLRDLEFYRLVRAGEPGEQRRGRLTNLEIDGAIFDLVDGVVVEMTIERVEIVICSFSTVVLQVAPVEVVVVDEGAIEDDASVGVEGAGDQVGGIGMGASVGGGAGAALGIGLDHYTSEVGNLAVDVVKFPAPPGGNSRVQGIKRI